MRGGGQEEDVSLKIHYFTYVHLGISPEKLCDMRGGECRLGGEGCQRKMIFCHIFLIYCF
jgi:hypothetical protein